MPIASPFTSSESSSSSPAAVAACVYLDTLAPVPLRRLRNECDLHSHCATRFLIRGPTRLALASFNAPLKRGLISALGDSLCHRPANYSSRGARSSWNWFGSSCGQSISDCRCGSGARVRSMVEFEWAFAGRQIVCLLEPEWQLPHLCLVCDCSSVRVQGPDSSAFAIVAVDLTVSRQVDGIELLF